MRLSESRTAGILGCEFGRTLSVRLEHNTFAGGHRKAVRTVFSGHAGASTVEARYRRHGGQIRLLRTSARPRFGSNGEFLGMIGVNLDITDSRRAENALREETAALEILNSTGSAVAAELDLEKLVQHVT